MEKSGKAPEQDPKTGYDSGTSEIVGGLGLGFCHLQANLQDIK